MHLNFIEYPIIQTIITADSNQSITVMSTQPEWFNGLKYVSGLDDGLIAAFKIYASYDGANYDPAPIAEGELSGQHNTFYISFSKPVKAKALRLCSDFCTMPEICMLYIPDGESGYHDLISDIRAQAPSAGLSQGLIAPDTLNELTARFASITSIGPPASDNSDIPANCELFKLAIDYRRSVLITPDTTPLHNPYTTQLYRARTLLDMTPEGDLPGMCTSKSKKILKKTLDRVQNAINNSPYGNALLQQGLAFDMLYELQVAVFNFKQSIIDDINFGTTVNLQDITVDMRPDTLVIDEGQSTQISLTLLPLNTPKRVIWTSSNPDVLSVEQDGMIYAGALSNGEAAVKAIITARLELFPSITASCAVTVKPRLADAHQLAQTHTRWRNADKLRKVAKAALADPKTYPTGFIPYPQEAVDAFSQVLETIKAGFNSPSLTYGSLIAFDNAIADARAALDRTWTVPLHETANLIDRIGGEGTASCLILEIIDDESGNDVFEVDWASGKPVLRGNNAIALTTAFNYYLKYFLYQEYPYIGQFEIKIPASLPEVTEKIRHVFPFKHRHYFNEWVDWRYFAFMYDIPMWQRRLDWFAMNGINIFQMGLAEHNIWINAADELGFSEDALAELRKSSRGDSQYFATYNISPQATKKAGDIAQAIADMAFKLGMEMEVFPFVGQVPFAFPAQREEFYVGTNPAAFIHIKQPGSVFNDVLAYPAKRWMNLPQGLFISPYVGPGHEAYADKMNAVFEKVSDIYWRSVQEFYRFDAWGFTPNYALRTMMAEQGFIVTGEAFPRHILTRIQDEMLKVNPDMVWLQDAWRYQDWIAEYIDPKRSIILDLAANNRPRWAVFERQKVPWIWCKTWNFGGNSGIDSGLGRMVFDIQEARRNAHYMTGIGATPEGSDTNPVLYELFGEMTWRDLSNIQTRQEAEEWVSRWLQLYTRRRYGTAVYDAAKTDIDDMWNALQKTVFCDFGMGDDPGQTLTNARPGVHGNQVKARFWAEFDGFTPCIPYNRADMPIVWEKTIKAAAAAQVAGGLSPQFNYDITDIARQALADLAYPVYKGIAHNFENLSKDKMLEFFDKMLEIIADMDKLLSTIPEFLLGCRLASAQARGYTAEDIYFYERLERTYLTYWILEEGITLEGGRDAYDAAVNNLMDYCNRHLAGLMKDYYGMRWRTVRDWMARNWDGTAVFTDHPYDEDVKTGTIRWVRGHGYDTFARGPWTKESGWPEDRKHYSVLPSGCPFEISKNLFEKYSGTND